MTAAHSPRNICGFHSVKYLLIGRIPKRGSRQTSSKHHGIHFQGRAVKLWDISTPGPALRENHPRNPPYPAVCGGPLGPWLSCVELFWWFSTEKNHGIHHHVCTTIWESIVGTCNQSIEHANPRQTLLPSTSTLWKTHGISYPRIHGTGYTYRNMYPLNYTVT